jgi:Fic family protein
MRSFQDDHTLNPVPADVVASLRRIDIAAGGELRYADQLPQLLLLLREEARIESITASSAIEGVLVDDARVSKLTSGRGASIRNRSEAEFAGYTAALDYLNQEDPGELSIGLILHLHRLLFSFTEDGDGGSFKSDDNLVVDRQPDGRRTVRFEPVSAAETPFYVKELIARSWDRLGQGNDHPLIVTAAFVLDLLCIHPFNDGNGRVARLATNYLIQHANYGVGRYVSLEQLIFETKDDYYGALMASTQGWFEAQHDLWPWARYLLSCIDAAYDRLAARIAADTSGGTKQSRVRDYVLLHAPDRFTIADIRRAVPGVSDNTIRLVLGALKDQGLITSDGTGRGATWQRARR